MDCSGLTHGPPVPHQPGPRARRDLQPEPVGLRDGVPEQFPPRLAHELARARAGCRRPTSMKIAPPIPARFIASRSAVIAFAAEVAVHEEPVDPGPGRVGRVEELAGQIVSWSLPRYARRNDRRPTTKRPRSETWGPTSWREVAFLSEHA